MAQKVGEWAGIPMGIEGERLVIDPRYPFAHILAPKRDREAELREDGYTIRNVFWCSRWRTIVAIYEKDGRIGFTPILGTGNSLTLQLSTLGCSFAWGIAQERAALELLGTLVRHHTFKMYLLTGSFLETSPRSGIHYMFRKLRPTVAIHEKKGKLCILTTLCMHPIGYYEGSWAGAMCPTDDVVAHLMMMRGDEHGFWKRCAQHAAHEMAAGL